MASRYVNSSAIGVDLNNGNATALFAVGTHVLGNLGSEYIYVHAATSIAPFHVVAVSTVSYTAGMASCTDIINGAQLAIAQTSISAQAYGWVALRGIGLTAVMTGSGTAPTGIGMFVDAQSSRTGCLSIQGSASGSVGGLQVTDASLTTSTGTGFVTLNVTWLRPAAISAGG